MSFDRIALLRNIGQFDSVDAGAQLPLLKLNLIYAENGRGKTTLAAILRSLGNSDPHLVKERHRLGSQHPPHIVLNLAGQATPVQFQNGAWTAPMDRIVVFDDAFVTANVCSGIEIEPSHRQNLHELILGAQGVGLNTALRGYAARIEQHNQALRAKGDAIPAAARGTLTLDAFCALKARPQIDAEIEAARRALSAAQAADLIRQRDPFMPLTLPAFDVTRLNALLGKTLPDLEADAAAQVRTHIRNLGRGGEAWISDGMMRITGASQGQGHETCPFCAQELEGSPLIRHYQAYFSEAYTRLKTAINETGQDIATTHGGEIPAAFERAVRSAVEGREFWRKFIDVPEIAIDTAALMRAWVAAREAVLVVLRAKAVSPLEAAIMPEAAVAAIEAYHALRAAITELSDQLQSLAPGMAIVKERAAGANVATLTADVAQLNAVKQRFDPAVVPLCDDYLAEKAAKKQTEGLRDEARAALDQYRQQIFPTYQNAINTYLGRFAAGFRLHEVGSVNNRGGSSATYSVLIGRVDG